MEVIATLLSSNGEKRIRLGCCPSCGYVGYIDRPERSWLYSFYETTWRADEGSDIASKADKLRRSYERGLLGRERPIVSLAKKTFSNKNVPICEIGCGYGKLLNQLKAGGFTNLIGVEPSAHRAKTAESSSGIPVVNASFESPRARAALERRAPLGFFFSHHVLEHTLEPAEIIAQTAEFQKPGGFLALSVPNGESEPSFGVLLFLPHLHSFSLESVKRLLARHGYIIRDSSYIDNHDITVLAERVKVALANPDPSSSFNYLGARVKKFSRALRKEALQRGLTRLWWESKSDKGGRVPYFKNRLAERVHWFSRRKALGLKAPRSLLVADLSRRQTPPEESPIEIQFAGNIKLFYK